jgi:hypothetical protein
MLKQLLKYEFKATKSLYFGLYLALALLSVVLGVSFRQENAWADNTNFGRLEVILMVLYLSVIFAIAVLCFVSMVQRFYKNLLGREGYLMHTLPVTETQLILSKLITSAWSGCCAAAWWASSASRSWLLSACSTRRPSAWWTGKAGSSCGGCCMGNWARGSGW